MNIVYLDIFLENVPKDLEHWEIHRHSYHSLLEKENEKEKETKEPNKEVYILKDDEWGKGGREHYGMKAQLWTSKDPSSSSKNIIVFRGTSLMKTGYSASVNLGNGLKMDFDQSGIGKSAFSLFIQDFMKWIEITKSQKKQLIITGHSLGGVLAIRLHAHLVQHYPEWSKECVESLVFNSPGLDDSTASILNGNENHHHIFNDGDFFPHLFTQPDTNHFVHQLFDSETFSFRDSLEIHKFPGLASLESRHVPVYVDTLQVKLGKNPQSLKKNLVSFKKSSQQTPQIQETKKILTNSLYSKAFQMQLKCPNYSIVKFVKRNTECNSMDEWMFKSDLNGHLNVYEKKHKVSSLHSLHSSFGKIYHSNHWMKTKRLDFRIV